jgi:non-ribosomal peptide synthetase-like protein
MPSSALGTGNTDMPTIKFRFADRIPHPRGKPVAVPAPRGSRPARRPIRLQQFFERTAAQRPSAVAVLDEDRGLSYRELDERANQLAHYLRGASIGPGRRVGILLNRSWRTYAALLGVLKAGATFVPIDPAAPPDRVEYIARDAGLDLLLTASELLPATAEVPCRVLPIDMVQDRLDAAPTTLPQPELAGDPTCYIIYTSGSSGRPKGVAVAHSSICNFIEVVPRVYDVRPQDRVYQGMTISFDFSIEEIWPTFAVGATLVVGPSDSRRLGAELADFLEEKRVTLLYCVPTLLATIPRDLPAIRILYVGGEACPAGLVERWSRPGRRMLNTYGPTEATVTATWGELFPGRPVTIGRPLPTYSVVLLDEHRRPVPDGEVGEICIGGPGVAIGYVGLPEKTADRFINHPLAPGGGRLYRTGDLGRIDGNGEIVYLGRADDEVKIRGHRVDLGEIENVLLEDGDVESAVAALVAVAGSDQLVSYVTRRDGSGTPDDAVIARLQGHLKRRLPDYMVPAYLEVLDALPAMPSGKVDRSKLPKPAGRRLLAGDGEVVAADGEMELRVRAVWAEALGLTPEELSVTADFFTDLGGHSLLAATAVSLMRERGVGTSPAVRDLYEHSTVRSLAAHLDARSGSPRAPARAAAPASRPLRFGSGRYGVAGIVQAAFLYALMLVVTLPVAAVYSLNRGEVSFAVLGQLTLAATIVYLGVRWLLAPVIVRLLGVDVQPGRYRLWGRVYLQLWATDIALALTPLPALSGSPLLPAYLRLLGARIGRNCHIGTSAISLPSLVRVGDNASIGYGVCVRPWVVENGCVVVEPLVVGDGAFVGAGSVLEPGSTVGAGAILAEQSTAGRGQLIGAGERWAGSPSAPSDRIDPIIEEMAAAPQAPGWTSAQRCGIVAGLALLEFLTLVMLAPSVTFVWWALLNISQTAGLIAAALVGPVFVATVCIVVAVTRALVLRRTPEGVHAARSALGVRKWIADKLLETSLTITNSLYSTLYTVVWLRVRGAKVDRGAEVSTAAHLDPDLLTLGRESFVADMAGVGSATFHNGRVAFRRTEVGSRAFVGNAALVPSGTRLGAGSLVGVQTVPPPEGVPDNSSWLGSPAINLPRRQSSGDFAERLTYAPSRWRLGERLVIEFFRVTLPASLISVTIYLYLLALSTVARSADLASTVLAAPGLAILTSLLLVALVAGIKWLVIGRYEPRVEPLWDRFVRRSEFVTGLYEAAAVPTLHLIVGTPFLPPVLRLFGAQIGRRTWIATTYLTEFDLVEIEDDAMVGRAVSLQTHLFEDRVMKMSTVKIGAGATIGDRTIVLYDASVGPDTALEPLSLVMKGEQLPGRTRWRGIPAEGVAA